MVCSSIARWQHGIELTTQVAVVAVVKDERLQADTVLRSERRNSKKDNAVGSTEYDAPNG